MPEPIDEATFEAMVAEVKALDPATATDAELAPMGRIMLPALARRVSDRGCDEAVMLANHLIAYVSRDHRECCVPINETE